MPGPLLFAVSLRDVTKWRDREERLREAEAKYRTLVEQVPLATYINSVGLPLQTVYMSPQIEAMLGYPVSSWLEPDFFVTALHPDDRERVQAEVERTHATGEDVPARVPPARRGRARRVGARRDGCRFATRSTGRRCSRAYLVDITDRHAAEERPALRAAAS